MSYVNNMFAPNLSAPSMYGAKTINVVKLVVQTAGTYNNQYRRPIQSHADNQLYNMIEETLGRTNNLDSLALAVPAFTLLKPAATPEAMMPIENGWETKRFRFLLHLTIEDHMGIVTNHYYSGFTGYSDYSFRNSIDPDMVFTINSASSTKNVTHRTPLGTNVVQAALSNNQILSSPNGYNGLISTQKTYSLRPETVVDDMLMADLRGLAETYHNGVAVISSPQLSARANNSAPGYMSSLLNGFKNTVIAGVGETADQNLEHVKTLVSSDPYSADRFLAWLLHRRVNVPSLGLGSHQFTINELMQLDSTTISKIQAADGHGIMNNFHQVGSTSDWGQSTAEVQFATMVAQATPTYMASLHIAKLAFTAMNLTLDGQISIIITNVQGHNQGVDMSRYLQVLIQRLTTELFMALSYGNSMPFSAEVNCDVNGETWVTVSLNQGPSEAFVTPTFCDSLFAPMATGNQRNLENLSNDFKGLFDLDEHVTSDQKDGKSSVPMCPSQSGPPVNSGGLFTPTGPSAASMSPFSNTPGSLFGTKNPGF